MAQGVGNAVENQTLNHPIVVQDGRTVPAHGLYQASFNLSEADFLRLQLPSLVAVAGGSAVLSFALSYGLPLLAKYLSDGTIPSKVDIWIALGFAGLGLLLMLLSWLFSSDRREVVIRIKEHFKRNPPQIQYFTPNQGGGQ